MKGVVQYKGRGWRRYNRINWDDDDDSGSGITTDLNRLIQYKGRRWRRDSPINWDDDNDSGSLITTDKS